VESIKRVLVPLGGGPHARLALRLAWDIAKCEKGFVTALRILPNAQQVNTEVEMDVLRQLVEDVLMVPESSALRLHPGLRGRWGTLLSAYGPQVRASTRILDA
jgi:hypothetical protein